MYGINVIHSDSPVGKVYTPTGKVNRNLYSGSGGVMTVSNDEFFALLASDRITPNHVLTTGFPTPARLKGVSGTYQVTTKSQEAANGVIVGHIPRTRANYTFPNTPTYLCLDADPDHWSEDWRIDSPERLMELLAKCLGEDSLDAYDWVSQTSSSSHVQRPDGSNTGFRGTHVLIAVDNLDGLNDAFASEGKKPNKLVLLAAYNDLCNIVVSASGSLLVRTVFDASVMNSPQSLLYIGGANFTDGSTAAPVRDHNTTGKSLNLLSLFDSLPSDWEDIAMAKIAALKVEAKPEAIRVGRVHDEDTAARTGKSVDECAAARTSGILPPWWPLSFEDGRPDTTVGQLIIAGDIEEGKGLRDPIHPEYGLNKTWYWVDNLSLRINTFAHGEHTFYTVLNLDQLRAEQEIAALLQPQTEQDGSELSPAGVVALKTETEDATAIAVAEMYKDKYVHIKGAKKDEEWHKWTGQHWKADTIGSFQHKVRLLSRKMAPAGGKVMAKNSFHSGVTTQCKRDPIFARDLSQFDTDHYLLNTPAGVIDLKTGETRPNAPSDMCTLLTGVEVAPIGDDKPERWLQFLKEIMGGMEGPNHNPDWEDTVDWLQIALGSMLSGAREDHWFMFAIGTTARNGKTTLGDLLLYIFGDYGDYMNSSTFMSKKSDDHTQELMALRGKRFIVASEVSSGEYWNEARLKDLTGEGVLRARFMGCNDVTFERSWKFLFYGNHRPSMRDADPAMQARFRCVPFNVSFEHCKDPDLLTKLKAEGPQILRWMVNGHSRWFDNGKCLGMCKVVADELTDYVAAQTTVATWIRERTYNDDNQGAVSSWSAATDLYKDYRQWKDVEKGEHPVSQKRFCAELKNAGYAKEQSNGIRYSRIALTDTRDRQAVADAAAAAAADKKKDD